MTSLSNLIKSEDYSGFDIEAFEEEDFADRMDFPVEDSANRTMILPLGENNFAPSVSMKKYDPKQKLEKVEREAYEKGFEQGQKDGLALGEKKAQETWKQMVLLFEELNLLKGRMIEETEEEIIRLSMAVARKIVKKELTIDSDTVKRSLQHALGFLKDKSFVRILINPGDMKTLEHFLPELTADNKIQKLELAEDNSVEPGGCILEAGFGRINATIEDQLAELETEMEEILHAGGGSIDGALP